MKVVIGYDGSELSDAVLDDLRCAMLPLDSEFIEKALVSRRIVSAVAQTSYALAQAQEFARVGGERTPAPV